MTRPRDERLPFVSDDTHPSPPAPDRIDGDGRPSVADENPGRLAAFDWCQTAEAAEKRGDWDSAIGLVAPHAECYSNDHHRHSTHLWHLRLLAVAGRLPELADLGRTDVHAVRALNTRLHEAGRGEDLRVRAEAGDRHALTHLVRFLTESGDGPAAMTTVERLAPGDEFLISVAAGTSVGQEEVQGEAGDDGAGDQGGQEAASGTGQETSDQGASAGDQ